MAIVQSQILKSDGDRHLGVNSCTLCMSDVKVRCLWSHSEQEPNGIHPIQWRTEYGVNGATVPLRLPNTAAYILLLCGPVKLTLALALPFYSPIKVPFVGRGTTGDSGGPEQGAVSKGYFAI